MRTSILAIQTQLGLFIAVIASAILLPPQAISQQPEAAPGHPAAADLHPALRALHDEAADYALRARAVERRITAEPNYSRIRELAEARLLDTIALYERDRQRIESATRTGLTDVRLRNQREELAELQRQIDQWQRQLQMALATTQRERVDLEYERRSLPSIDQAQAALLTEITGETDLESAPPALPEQINRALTEHRSQLDQLLETLKTLEALLLEIEQHLTPLNRLVREYRRVLDERILWIRSMDPIGGGDVAAAWDSLAALASPTAWATLGREQWQQASNQPLAPLLAVLVFIIWFVRRTRRAMRLRELAEQVQSPHSDQFQHTAEAALYTLINSLFWPAVVWVIGWQLVQPDEPSVLAHQVASGLNRTAWILLLFTFTLQFARNSGLARAHFHWHDDVRNLLRWNLRWLGFVILPLSFVMAASEWEPARSGSDPLGRMAFIAAMLVLIVFVAIVLRPHKGVLKHLVEEAHSPWIERLSYFWYVAATLVPMALAVLAASGFFYTARQLENHLVGTFGFIVALVLINGLVMRWLFLIQRRMAIAEANRKHEEAQQLAEAERNRQEQQPGGHAAGAGAPKPPPSDQPADDTSVSAAAVAPGQAVGAEGETIAVDEAKLDLQLVNSQTRRILRTAIVSIFLIGLWLIWSNMLPGINMLDRVEIWPNFGNVREAAVAAPPVENIVGREWSEQIPPPFSDPARPFDEGDAARLAGDEPAGGVMTLTNVLICLLIVVVAYLVGRNIPGLLEITVLQRLPLQDSSRYAVVTLTRYFIIVIGTILAFGAIGIGWSQVQWLVAAITLGIGFGLQEIVANFISGIIILFEQPIRVGDTVTVSNTSGTVTRIRMRATTIIDWDRKELIIPNKTFITGDVINWTLTEPVLRIVIPVGIAYGSDTEKAEEILLRVAKENPTVLADPPPSVVFNEFGDSALIFNLRVFIPHISELINVKHNMHRAIDRAFRESGIEIAFPQRDIHVRTIKSTLPVRQEPTATVLPKEGAEE